MVFLGIILLQFYNLRHNFSYDRSNYGLDVLRNKILYQETSIHSYINDELEIGTLGYEAADEYEDLDLDYEPETRLQPPKKFHCNCNSGRLCVLDFLKRFKGITFDKSKDTGQTIIKFIGPVFHLELIRESLKKNKYEMLFGEASKHRKIHRQELANFLNAFSGIKVEESGKIIFVGHANQLKFIKQQLKEYDYEMIFGELESEGV